MSDQELAERLARLAAEMSDISEEMHLRGTAVDAAGDWRRAHSFHRHGAEMAGAAKLAREWAIEISRGAA